MTRTRKSDCECVLTWNGVVDIECEECAEMSKATVFVVTGHSESGDDYGPVVFTKEPSDAKLKELAHSWDGDEDEDGCGDFGSWVYLSVSETEVEET
jgi:hypothetical protein